MISSSKMHQQMENYLSLSSVIVKNKLRSVNQDGVQVQVMTSCAIKEYYNVYMCNLYLHAFLKSEVLYSWVPCNVINFSGGQL